jgi:hypothetical protein
MILSGNQAEKLHAFAELDRTWREHNRGPEPVSGWPQAAFYLIGFFLTAGWTSADLWIAKCGTPFAGHFSICSLFGLVALATSVWAGFSRHNWPAAVRFLVSGAVPVAFPLLIELLFRP